MFRWAKRHKVWASIIVLYLLGFTVNAATAWHSGRIYDILLIVGVMITTWAVGRVLAHKKLKEGQTDDNAR